MTERENRRAVAFALYAGMTRPRTLKRLSEHFGDLGAPVSLQTLKRWSTADGWQARLREVDQKSVQRVVHHLARESQAMHERHAELARAIQAAGGQGLQNLLRDPGRIAALTPSDIARLIDLGLKTEAAATRQSADRHEVSLELTNLLTHEIVDAFLLANDQTTADRRAQLFGEQVDRITEQFLERNA